MLGTLNAMMGRQIAMELADRFSVSVIASSP